MSNIDTEQTPVTAEPKPKKRAKRKDAGTPRAPRVIDPGVAAIRKEALERVKAYRAEQASAKSLTRLTEQCLKLTESDRDKLVLALTVPATATT